MSRRTLALASLTVVICMLLGALVPTPSQAAPALRLYLRRAVFDPLLHPRQPSALAAGASRSGLLLVQLSSAPDADARARLDAAGLEPLAYVPDNGFVVRLRPGTRGPLVLDNLRWSGPLDPLDKLDPALDSQLAVPGTSLDLRLLVTPGADPDGLRAAVAAAGGQVLDGQSRLLRVRLPASALGGLAQRDDLLWAERAADLRLTNSAARDILGVDRVREEIGLDGSGQIVAVTDTGLDIQSDVQRGANPDFLPGRIARGFSRGEMYSACAGPGDGSTWSDLNGHGTHVAGTILGSGAALSSRAMAGMAPAASLVVQSVSSGGSNLDCLGLDESFLQKAYGAGARIQNMSFGGGTFGQYDSLAQTVDDFAWQHKDHLIVISAGNAGEDCEPLSSQNTCIGNGVIDDGSITPPATAKNAISVGASENYHPPSTSSCRFSPVDSLCWIAFSFGNYGLDRTPFVNDFISNNPDGLAAFSSRGPTKDGRIKPEIVAPGTNVISARSHHSSAGYQAIYSADYAYDSGTSMAAPMVSGLAALVRQWLVQHGEANPSAALVKALLLNGAANISPGQYGQGAQREIPAAWPNNAEGWGRASIVGAVGLDDPSHRFWSNTAGLTLNASADYSVTLNIDQNLRATLVWSDPAAIPLASKTLVNDLDLQLLDPNGAVVARGNSAAALPASCRGSGQREGADTCNNQEAFEFKASQAGVYTLRVRGAVVPEGPQPFALVAGAPTSPAVPSLNPPASAPTPVQTSSAAGSPVVTLTWGAVLGARTYEVSVTGPGDGDTRVYSVGARSLGLVLDSGSYQATLRACNSFGCGPASPAVSFSTSATPRKIYMPQTSR